MPDFINNIPVAKHFITKDAQDRNVFNFNAPFVYHYITQQNDDLKRSWAMRMGFGKVNAYRAVAHSIRNKGLYEYTLNRPASQGGNNMGISSDGSNPYNIFRFADATGDSRGFVNPDGLRIVHFGSRIKEGTKWFEIPPITRGPTSGNDGILNVLDWGGIDYKPPAPPLIIYITNHNNQGVTVINSNVGRAFFDVPANCILAIDGIILSEQPQNCNYIYASKLGSKILIEGYIHDVEVFGNLRTGDVTVNSTINNGVANIPGCIGFSYESHAYGKISTMNHGAVYSWGNTTFHPGAGVYLRGQTDFILNGNSITTFKSATEVVGNTNRKIIAYGNSEIIIDTNSTVIFDCELVLTGNSKLIIRPGGVLHLKKLTASNTTTITMHGGSTLFLDCDNHTAGMITTVNASSSNPVNFRSKIIANCHPHDTPNYLNNNSSCWANLHYRTTGSNLTTSNRNTRNVSFTTYQKTSEGVEEARPFEIHSVVPNPANTVTNVTYSVPEEGNIRFSVSDVLGTEFIAFESVRSAGKYTDAIDISKLASGVYLLKVSTNTETKVIKFIKNQ